jgi:hypothetical protein
MTSSKPALNMYRLIIEIHLKSKSASCWFLLYGYFTATTNHLLLKITKWEDKHKCHRVPNHLVKSPNQASYQDKWTGCRSFNVRTSASLYTLISKSGSDPSTYKMEATFSPKTTLPASKTVPNPDHKQNPLPLHTLVNTCKLAWMLIWFIG